MSSEVIISLLCDANLLKTSAVIFCPATYSPNLHCLEKMQLLEHVSSYTLNSIEEE